MSWGTGDYAAALLQPGKEIERRERKKERERERKNERKKERKKERRSERERKRKRERERERAEESKALHRCGSPGLSPHRRLWAQAVGVQRQTIIKIHSLADITAV